MSNKLHFIEMRIFDPDLSRLETLSTIGIYSETKCVLKQFILLETGTNLLMHLKIVSLGKAELLKKQVKHS